MSIVTTYCTCSPKVNKIMTAKAMRLRNPISKRARLVDQAGSREIADMAEQLKRRGIEVLPLKGMPVELPPMHVLEAAKKSVEDNIIAPSRGLPELRTAISVKLREENSIEVDPENEVLVTNGAMHALYISLTAILDPGDEVLMYSPTFFFYGILELVGGTPIYAPLREENGFRFDLSVLEEKISPRAKVILVSTPANPTGYVATREDLADIADIAKKYDLLVISDESYEKMVYDSRRHFSIASFPGMKERTITIHSFTKSYALPQWRIGYIAAPPDFTKYFKKVLEWMNLTCNYMAQKAAHAALTGPQEWVRRITTAFETYRDIAFEGVSAIKGLSCIKPQGGPFLFFSISQLGIGAKEFSSYLLSQFGVPTTPGDYFQSADHVRISFGATKEVLSEGINRLQIAVYRIRKGQNLG